MKKPTYASACRNLPVASQMPSGIRQSRRPQDRPGEPDARLGGRVVAERLGRDDGAEEGDEHRRRGLDPLAAELDHVPHLVDEQQQHEPTAKVQPQISAYAAIETSIVPDVANSLIFGSRKSSTLSFARKRDDRDGDRAEELLRPLA